jgi:NADH:ubiquinone oxidoreductase subunit 5 (subunit L)/multisubunit Na+/H+ antiporter MnhA subunit
MCLKLKLDKGSSRKKWEMKIYQNMNASLVIHAMSDEQNMRKMGRLASLLPFTYVMMFIYNLSLIGFLFVLDFILKMLF